MKRKNNILAEEPQEIIIDGDMPRFRITFYPERVREFNEKQKAEEALRAASGTNAYPEKNH